MEIYMDLLALGIILILFAAVTFSILTYFVKKADIDDSSATFWDSLFATGKYKHSVPGVFWMFLLINVVVISVIYWR